MSPSDVERGFGDSEPISEIGSLSPNQVISSTGSPSTSNLGAIPSPGSVDAASLPFSRCGAPAAFERANYIRILEEFEAPEFA